MSAELVRTLKIVVAVPGALALVWVLYQALVVQRRQSSEAAREWPSIAADLGLEFFVPGPGPSASSDLVAGMRGLYRGRPVTIVTGTYLSGGSSQRTTTGTTSWTTAAPEGTPSVYRKAVPDRLLADRGALTGDDVFDREYAVEGAAEPVEQMLTPSARDAIRAFGENFRAFRLGEEGLTHQEDAIELDADRIRGVLNWQAFVLDGLASDRASAVPDPVTRKSLVLPWMVAIALIMGSALVIGAIDRKARLDRQARVDPPGAPQSAGPRVGDAVAANFGGKGRWYVGVVVEAFAETSTVRIVYQDGESEILPTSKQAPDPLGAGSSAMAPYEGISVMAEVVRRAGDAVLVKFRAGVEEWRSAGLLGLNPVTAQGEAKPRESAEQVWATWEASDPWLYPAEVVETEGERRRLVFRDGESGWRTPAQIRSGLPALVEVEVLHDKTWVKGTVRRRIKHALEVQLDEQRVIWTALSKVRRAAP